MNENEGTQNTYSKDEQSGERSGGINFYGKTDITGNVAGQDIDVSGGQAIGTTPAGLTAGEQEEVKCLLIELKNQLEAADVPENKKSLGREFAKQLEVELIKTDGQPDASTIKVAGSWLLDNISALAGTLTSVFVNPIVGKVVAAAGDIAADWVKERFGQTD